MRMQNGMIRRQLMLSTADAVMPLNSSLIPLACGGFRREPHQIRQPPPRRRT